MASHSLFTRIDLENVWGHVNLYAVGAGQAVRAVNWTLERMQTSDPDKIYPGQLSHTLLLLNIILSVFNPVSKAIRYLNLVLKSIKNQGQGPNYFQSSLLESPWLQ